MPERRLLTGGLVLIVTAVAFEGLAAPTILPATLEQLGGVALYGWAFSGFWLSNLVGITLAGAEADRRGIFRPFAMGAAAFSIGLVVAGLAPDMTWVVAGRIVQGLGAGAISSVTYVAIARGYPAAVQPRMIATISSAWVVPGLVGPALAGWVAEVGSWRWVFLGLAPLLPLTALALAPALRHLPALPPSAGGRPAAGLAVVGDALLLAVGAGVALAGLSWGEPLPALALGAIGVAVAIAPARRLLPPGTLTARSERGATIAVIALVCVAFFGVEAFIPLAVASIRNAGTVAGGLALTAAALTWAAGSWLQARLATRRSRRAVTVAGLALIGAAMVPQALVPLSAAVPTWTAAAAWAVAGLGMGLSYSTLTLAVIESAPTGSEGGAIASAQLANTLGIAVGTGLAGAVVAMAAGGSLGLAPGVVMADLVMLAVLLLALAAARRMPRRAGVQAADRLAGAPAEHGPTLSP
jgi:MFS family permease